MTTTPYERGSTANILSGFMSFWIPGLGQFLQGRPLGKSLFFFVPWLALVNSGMLMLGSSSDGLHLMGIMTVLLMFVWNCCAAREASVFSGNENHVHEALRAGRRA